MARRTHILACSAFLVAAAVANQGCAKPIPSVHPTAAPAALGSAAPRGQERGPFADAKAVDPTLRKVDPSMITHGTRAAQFAQEARPPATAVCARSERKALAFDESPTYTDKVERGRAFTARIFVRNDADCTRRISLPLSFTPPKTTNTRSVDFAAYIPPRGAFVELGLDAKELADALVVPGRYAITFAVQDEDGAVVGRSFAGNAFRLGRDDVAIFAQPRIPTAIGLADDLVVPFAIENVGDTGNRVTPLVVFTRPGDTRGIEHYEPAQLVPPGRSTYVVHLSPDIRETQKIGPGSWLVTVSMFDAVGDRMNSFAGLPLTIGSIDVRMKRPELPVRLKPNEALRAKFAFENLGDTPDTISAVVVFTKPGTTTGHEFTFALDARPGSVAFDAVIAPNERIQRGVESGVWLVSTAAFRSSGERIKSYTGHYLEILTTD